MKKIVMALLVTLMFSSCVTTHMVRYTEDEEEREAQNAQFYSRGWSGKDENLEVKVTSAYEEEDKQSRKNLSIDFYNISDKPVVLKSDLLSMIDNENGRAYNLISIDGFTIHSDMAQPDFLIPANKMITRTFVARDAIHYDDGWKTKQWVPTGDSTLTVTYRDQKDNMEKSVTAELTSKTDPEKEAVEVLGTVESSAFYPHILFINPVDWNRRQLYKKALAKAKSKYGENVELYNLDFVGKWNPLSLVLYFDVFGWCENAKLKADVIKSK